jgi:hypothetical protein
MLFKKKTEKKSLTPRNIMFRENFFGNILNIIKGDIYIFTHLRLIHMKRKERKLNQKIWYDNI